MFCREHIAQLRDYESKFKAKGATLAVIGLGNVNYARSFREDTGINFPLLIDEQREAYRALGLKKANLLHLLRKDNAAARKRAKAGGHRQLRLGKDPFQL
ncbi:MAG TPA: peroxiredoxin-like family protein, partial [Blastocatellia bacterium]